MTHGSLFSGIGGFDLAAEWMGWENIFHCEWNPFGQKVLKHHFPNSISYNDITKTDFTIHRGGIDILTGGFPCQPYSLAGKRKGKEDSRHIFPQMLRAIREIQPSWIVGENVLGIINWGGGVVFHEVQTEMENEGYEVFPIVLPAASVNAPHRRERVWFIAKRNVTNTMCIRLQDTEKGAYIHSSTGKTQSQRSESSKSIETNGRNGNATNTGSKGYKWSSKEWQENNINREDSKLWGATSKCYNKDFWENFPTQSPICGGNDGLPSKLDGITFSKWRNESIKAFGNAIVPQVAYQIFKAVNNYESRITF